MRTFFAIALFVFASAVNAQTAGVVNVTVTPASGNSPLAQSVTWSTTPVATSCVASGGWSGNKAASGTAALPAVTDDTSYTLTCAWPGAAGSALITWSAPSTNTDGTALTNLASYKIVYGTSSTNLSQSLAVSNPGMLSGTVNNLTGGTTYFFAVRAVNALGTESGNSNVTSKAIVGGTPPTASKTVTVTVNKVPSPPTDTTVIETTAYNVVPNLQRFTFERGSRVGTVKLGAACDEARATSDGYSVISRNSQVNPRPATGTVLVAKCG